MSSSLHEGMACLFTWRRRRRRRRRRQQHARSRGHYPLPGRIPERACSARYACGAHPSPHRRDTALARRYSIGSCRRGARSRCGSGPCPPLRTPRGASSAATQIMPCRCHSAQTTTTVRHMQPACVAARLPGSAPCRMQQGAVGRQTRLVQFSLFMLRASMEPECFVVAAD